MNKYLKAVSFNFLYLITSTVAFLILTPLAIRVMGEEFYGLFVILSSIMLFSNIGNLGIGTIVNKFAAEATGEDKAAYYGSIFSAGFLMVAPMALLTMIVLWAVSGAVARSNDVAPLLEENFRTAIRVCSFGILPQYLTKIPLGFLLSQLRNDRVRLMDLFTNLFPWIGGIGISLIQKNLVWIAIWYVVLQVMILCVYLWFIRNDISWFMKPNKALFNQIRTFSVFMFLESAANSSLQQFDRIIVGAVLGPVMAGVYSVGTSVGLRLSILAGQVTEILVPYSSEKNSMQANSDLYTTVRKVSKFIGIVITVAGGLAMIWIDEILYLWISPDYADRNAALFRLIILGYCILAISRIGNQTLHGIGKIRFTSLTYTLTTICVLALMAILLHNVGIMGAAIARLGVIVLLIYNLTMYKIVNKEFVIFHFISDNAVVLLLPFIAILSLGNNSVTFKLLLSVILIVVNSLWLFHDKFLLSIASQQLRKIFRDTK